MLRPLFKGATPAANGRTHNNEKKDAHHWVYIEFASRRAHRNNMDARRGFFLVNVIGKLAARLLAYFAYRLN